MILFQVERRAFRRIFTITLASVRGRFPESPVRKTQSEDEWNPRGLCRVTALSSLSRTFR